MKTSVVMVCGMAAILAGVDSSWAQAQAAGQAGQPKIAFETNVYDFGKVISGEVVRHDVIFTNIGQATLEILSVHPACGCTTAGQWDKTIEPGKTGRIPLEFNSATFSGTVAKSATVACNDPTQTNITLQFTGSLWKAIEVTPTMASFGIPKEHQTNETRVLRIVNNLEEPITL